MHHSRLGSLQWQVPSEVLKSKDEKVKAAWCRGYADGDGTARPYEVDFDSTNRPGLEQVQDLLQSLRISSKLRGPYHRRPYLDRFTLTISKKNLSRYAELIGFNRPSRKHRLYEALKKKPRWIASHNGASREARDSLPPSGRDSNPRSTARKAAMLNRATPPERPKTLNAVSFTFW